MKKTIKIIPITLTAILLSIYAVSFVQYSVSNTKTWSVDKKEYTYYEEKDISLFKLHKPALFIQHYVFNKPYVIGHHHDPDGNKSGHYY
jgi:hypothetical protein